MGTARIIESFWTCRKRYRLERAVVKAGHKWPSPDKLRVGEPSSAAECCARILSWLDSRDDPYGRLPAADTAEEVELAAAWSGKPGLLWEALKDSGWIERRDGRWQWNDYKALNQKAIQARINGRLGGRPAKPKKTQRKTQRGTQPITEPGTQTADSVTGSVAVSDAVSGETVRKSGSPEVCSPEVRRSGNDDDDEARARDAGSEPPDDRDTEPHRRGYSLTERGQLLAMQDAYERAFVVRRWAPPDNAPETEGLVVLAMRRHGAEEVRRAFERFLDAHDGASPPQLYRFASDVERWLEDGAGEDADGDGWKSPYGYNPLTEDAPR